MAFKTMLRQLISKWGIMSVEFQTAMSNDMAMIDENGQPQYVDNQEEIIEAEVSTVGEEPNQNNDPFAFDEE